MTKLSELGFLLQTAQWDMTSYSYGFAGTKEQKSNKHKGAIFWDKTAIEATVEKVLLYLRNLQDWYFNIKSIGI